MCKAVWLIAVEIVDYVLIHGGKKVLKGFYAVVVVSAHKDIDIGSDGSDTLYTGLCHNIPGV